MKLFLKRILNERMVSILKQIKLKLFPSKNEIEFIKSQKEMADKRREFYGLFIEKGDLCFDVGANIGNRVEPLLQLGANIIAIEPQKTCCKTLYRKYGNKIKIIRKGVGSIDGIMDFYISETSVLSSFSKEWIDSMKLKRFKEYNWNKIQKIEMTTLDKLISEFGVPAFIKIDVEGYELEVLKGLNTAIKNISFEYTTPEQTQRAIECIRHLQKINANIECNYCIDEFMTLQLQHWLTPPEMEKHILTPDFINSGFGDVYVRCK